MTDSYDSYSSDSGDSYYDGGYYSSGSDSYYDGGYYSSGSDSYPYSYGYGYDSDFYGTGGTHFKAPAVRGLMAMLWLAILWLVVAAVLSCCAKWRRHGKRDLMTTLLLPTAIVVTIMTYLLRVAILIVNETLDSVTIYFQIIYIVSSIFDVLTTILLFAVFILIALDLFTYRYGKNLAIKIPCIIFWVIIVLLQISQFGLNTAAIIKSVVNHYAIYGYSYGVGSYDPSTLDNEYDSYRVEFGSAIASLVLSSIFIGVAGATLTNGRPGVTPFLWPAVLFLFLRSLMQSIFWGTNAFPVVDFLEGKSDLSSSALETYSNILVAWPFIEVICTGFVFLFLALVGFAYRKHANEQPAQPTPAGEHGASAQPNGNAPPMQQSYQPQGYSQQSYPQPQSYQQGYQQQGYPQQSYPPVAPPQGYAHHSNPASPAGAHSPYHSPSAV